MKKTYKYANKTTLNGVRVNNCMDIHVFAEEGNLQTMKKREEKKEAWKHF